MTEYISVPEYARLKGITTQAVYKKLSTDSSKLVKVVNGKKVIVIAKLSKEDREMVANYSGGKLSTDDNQGKYIEHLESEIDLLKGQIEIKDRQITDLQADKELLRTDMNTLHIQLMQSQKNLELLTEGKRRRGLKETIKTFWNGDSK